jgi:hypothetical protein
MSTGWVRRATEVVVSSLVDRVDRDHRQPDRQFRRRRSSC